MQWGVGHITVPSGFRHKDYQWLKLMGLWGGTRGGVEVGSDLTRPCLAVRVVERLSQGFSSRVSFWYSRDVGGVGKTTYVNPFGLVGLSRLDFSDRRVILTEGVSDYLSASMVFPSYNILGFTSIGGSRAASRIVASLFDDIVYVSDNDLNASGVNTGVRAAGRVLSFYRDLGKRVSVHLPSVGFKDFTEEFMYRLAVERG